MKRCTLVTLLGSPIKPWSGGTCATRWPYRVREELMSRRGGFVYCARPPSSTRPPVCAPLPPDCEAAP